MTAADRVRGLEGQLCELRAVINRPLTRGTLAMDNFRDIDEADRLVDILQRHTEELRDALERNR